MKQAHNKQFFQQWSLRIFFVLICAFLLGCIGLNGKAIFLLRSEHTANTDALVKTLKSSFVLPALKEDVFIVLNRRLNDSATAGDALILEFSNEEVAQLEKKYSYIIEGYEEWYRPFYDSSLNEALEKIVLDETLTNSKRSNAFLRMVRALDANHEQLNQLQHKLEILWFRIQNVPLRARIKMRIIGIRRRSIDAHVVETQLQSLINIAYQNKSESASDALRSLWP